MYLDNVLVCYIFWRYLLRRTELCVKIGVMCEGIQVSIKTKPVPDDDWSLCFLTMFT